MSNTFTSRYIGVEVGCGTFFEVFLYYTNDTVAGGANIMIEVQRQGNPHYCLVSIHLIVICVVVAALRDLGKILAEDGIPMPKELILQFDNCGENKVYILLILFAFYFVETNINICILSEQDHVWFP